MFDGQNTVEVDWDGPLVVLDLPEMLDDKGLAILMACATAWIQAAVVRPGAGHRFIVLDERGGCSTTWGRPGGAHEPQARPPVRRV
jgi:hypothetical protein